MALKASTVLGSKVNELSSFDRKHYFYLDQPLGYQITQHFRPLAHGGRLKLSALYDDVSEDVEIGIEQVQIEQDTAKLNFNSDNSTVDIDYNRAGVPLIEVVTKPDFTHLRQVRAFVKKYASIMESIGVSLGDLETGALRCDVNVSVAGGNRVEIKNLGSSSEIAAAVTHEYARQVQLLKDGLAIDQETRSWNGEVTSRARSKEDAIDYRYFPDMELPLVHLRPTITSELAPTLPELPEEKTKRLMSAPYSLEIRHARFLTNEVDLYEYFVTLHQQLTEKYGVPSQVVRNWFVHELMGAFKKHNVPVSTTVVPVEAFSELISMVHSKKITGLSGKLLLNAIVQSPDIYKGSISQLVLDYDLAIPEEVGTDDFTGAVAEICQEIIDRHPDVVEKVKAGKHKSIKFLVGQAMRDTQGKVDSKIFESCFKSLILDE